MAIVDMNEHGSSPILVNAAAFIGSDRRNRESVPCDVLREEGIQILVRTQFPYRVFETWVNREWVDRDVSTPESRPY